MRAAIAREQKTIRSREVHWLHCAGTIVEVGQASVVMLFFCRTMVSSFLCLISVGVYIARNRISPPLVLEWRFCHFMSCSLVPKLQPPPFFRSSINILDGFAFLSIQLMIIDRIHLATSHGWWIRWHNSAWRARSGADVWATIKHGRTARRGGGWGWSYVWPLERRGRGCSAGSMCCAGHAAVLDPVIYIKWVASYWKKRQRTFVLSCIRANWLKQ